MAGRDHVVDDLAAWRAGALAPARAREVDEHLAGCTACAAEARADEALDLALGRVGVGLAPGAGERVRGGLDRLGHLPPPTPVPWPLLAGVAFVLGLAATADLRDPPPPPVTREPSTAPLPADLRPRDATPDRRGAPTTSQET